MQKALACIGCTHPKPQPGVLEIIKANHEFHNEKYTKYFQQMLHKWLQSKPNATWKELEVALTNVTRQKHNLPVVPDIHGKETVGQKSISYH